MNLSDAISTRLRNKTPFEITSEGTIHDRTWGEWLAFSGDTEVDQGRILSIRDCIQLHLSHEPRAGDPTAMKGNAWIQTAKLFRKLYPKESKELQTEELLARLGLRRDQVTSPAAKSFFEWATKIRADSYMAYFGHRIRVLDSGDVQIQTLKTEIVWSRVQDKAFQWMSDAAACKNPVQIRLYDENGPTFCDLFKVTGCNPLSTLNIPSGKALFRILVHAPYLGVDQNHSWWQYVEPNGIVHSYTKYRPFGKPDCGVSKGSIAERPLDDGWCDYSIDGVLEVEIDPARIPEMLRYEKHLGENSPPFHNMWDNCTNEALDRLQKLGIFLPPFDISFWQVYIRPSLAKAALIVDEDLPRSVASVAEFVAAVAGNAIQFWYRGYNTDSYFNAYPLDPRDPSHPIRRNINSISAFFNPENVRFTSPYILTQKVIKPLEAWRKSQLASLPASATDEQKEALRYSIPPEWRGTPAKLPC